MYFATEAVHDFSLGRFTTDLLNHRKPVLLK